MEKVKMILIIKKKEKENLSNIFKSLCDDFNKIAKESKSKFRIIVQYEYPHLIKTIAFGLGNGLGKCQIYYDKVKDEFSFCDGIDEVTFNDVKFLLEKIPQKFIIETI